MKAFFGFLASPAGRVTRIIAGLILILIGLLALGGIWGWILAIVGLVACSTGASLLPCSACPSWDLASGRRCKARGNKLTAR